MLSVDRDNFMYELLKLHLVAMPILPVASITDTFSVQFNHEKVVISKMPIPSQANDWKRSFALMQIAKSLHIANSFYATLGHTYHVAWWLCKMFSQSMH